MAAQQTLPELSHEITGRFRTDVSSKHRLAYVSNGVVRHFPIHVMLDPEERHEQLVCFCSEIAQT
jgi:head-tail adaptor